MNQVYRTYLILALILLLGGSTFVLVMFRGALGNTVTNLTLRTNPDLRNGLIGYWTFDGKDLNQTSSLALDRSGLGNNGTIRFFGKLATPGSTATTSYTTATASGSYSVTEGVTSITVYSWGAGGGDGSLGNCSGGCSVTSGAGGGGGFAKADIAVTGPETLTVRVGGGGAPGVFVGGSTKRGGGGAGGGYSGVLRSSTVLIQAGGGGGGGGAGTANGATGGAGGAGGGTNGNGGTAGSGSGGAGGGGATGGTAGTAGAGGTNGGADGEAGNTDGTYEGGDGGDISGADANTSTGGTNGGGAGGATDSVDITGGGGGGGGRAGGGGGEAGTGATSGGGGGGGSDDVSGGTNTTETAGSGTSPGASGIRNTLATAGECLTASGNGGAAESGKAASGANSGAAGCVVIVAATPGTAGSPNFATSTPGAIGGALDFGGDSNYVFMGNISGAGTIRTLSFWMKSATSTVSNQIMQVSISGGDRIETNSSSDILATGFPAGVVYVDAKSTSARIPNTQWHHVVITDATGVSGTDFNVGSTTLGRFGGVLDDVRIYNRVLSASEIKRLYDLGATTHLNVTLDTNPDLKRGLVGHWTFDGKEVNRSAALNTNGIIDRSGQGNNGQLVGHNTSTTTVSGRIGQALDFDGSDDDVRVAAHASIANIFDGGGTIATWIYPHSDGGGDFGRILDKTVSTGDFGWSLYTAAEASGRVKLYFNQDFTTGALVSQWQSNATVVPLNEWSSVVVVYNNDSDANDPTIYVNSVAIALTKTSSGTDTREDDTNHNLRIGNRANGSRNFDGFIDDVRIYNRVLTQNEIKRLYDLGATTHLNVTLDTNPDLKRGLVGHWSFDGPTVKSSINQILDISGQGNTASTTGMNTSTTTAPGKIGQAIDLDGGDDRVRVPFISLPTQLTLSAWVYAATSTTVINKTFIAWGGVGGNSVEFKINNSGKLFYAEWDGTWNPVNSGKTLQPRHWYHVAAVVDRGGADTAQLYIDGVADGSISGVARTVSLGFLSFGAIQTTSSFYFQPFGGWIDDVRIYNRLLTASEIQKLYQLGR